MVRRRLAERITRARFSNCRLRAEAGRKRFSTASASRGQRLPVGGVIFDKNGNLFGSTGYGVFELRPSGDGWSERVISSAGGNINLAMDSAGNLYGTDLTEPYGHVWEISPTSGTWTTTVLYSFTDQADGGLPLAGVILDASGNLYGTASAGGSTANPNCYPDGCGTVWELTPSTGKFTVLHTFGGYCWGAVSALIFDSAGNLYGTTDRGGAYGAHSPGASIFELTLQNGVWNDTVLHSFNTPSGDSPVASLILHDGVLYGTTGLGGYTPSGSFGDDVVFSFTP